MTNTRVQRGMTRQAEAYLYVRPPVGRAVREAIRRRRRRRALVNTLMEAFATIGLGACFVLCAIMALCMV